MKKLSKILFWTILSVLTVLILAAVLTQTSLFRSWLKDLVQRELNMLITAEFSAGELNGNIFSELEITDISLISVRDTLATVEKIGVSYNLLALLDNRIAIHDLEITAPHLRLEKDQDEIWNIEKLIRTDSLYATDIPETDSGLNLAIQIDQLTLTGGEVTITDTDAIIPEQIRGINISAHGGYAGDNLHIILDSLSFNSINPDFKLKRLTFEFNKNDQEVSLKNLEIYSAKNTVTAEVNLSGDTRQIGSASVTANQLDLNELDIILPDIILKNRPDLNITIDFSPDTSVIMIQLRSAKQYVRLHCGFKNYRSLTDSKLKTNIDLSGKIELEKIKLKSWQGNSAPDIQANGQIVFSGKYLGSDDFQGKISGRFDNFSFRDFNFTDISMDALIDNKSVQTDLKLLSQYGDIYVNAEIEQPLLSKRYFAHADIQNLNLLKIFPADSISSDLNINLSIAGEKVDSVYSSVIMMQTAKSQIYGYQIDTMFTRLHHFGPEYDIDTLCLAAPVAGLQMKGKGRIGAEHHLDYLLTPGELQLLADILIVDSLGVSGQISGTVETDLSFIEHSGKYLLNNLIYNDITVGSIAGNTNFSKEDNILNADVNLNLKELIIGGFGVEGLEITAGFDNDEVLSDIKFRLNRLLGGKFNLRMIPDSSKIQVDIPQFEVTSGKEKWSGRLRELTYFTLDKKINLADFKAESSSGNKTKSVMAGGTLSLYDQQNFKLQIRNIDLDDALNNLSVKQPLGGVFNLDVLLQGSTGKPEIKGEFSLDQGFTGNIEFEEIAGQLNYINEKLDLKLLLNFNNQDSLLLSGFLPLHLSVSDTLPVLDMKSDVHLTLKSDQIPVALFLNNIPNTESAKGFLNCNLSVTNTLSDPEFMGFVRISDGGYSSAYWGIDYKDINLNLSAKQDSFLLDQFRITRDGGSVSASGMLELDLSKTENKIKYSDLQLIAKDFFIVQHKDFEIQVSSDLKYVLQQSQPKITGYIDVKRSSFYLPAIFERIGLVSGNAEENKPALVRVREQNTIHMQEDTTKSSQDVVQMPGFLDRLEGNLSIRIPRNTWIRNRQLRIEIEGDLNLKMESGEQYLSGPIKIVRGQYDIVGHRFTVVEGKIDFLGTKEIKPPIYLEAEYTYRTTAREKKDLILKVTGDLQKPVIKFYVDNNEITQDDAISIVLFGRRKDELSFGTQTDMRDSDLQGTVAMGIVSNLVSDKLSRSVGEDLKLDVIEVNATDSWQSANFVVGKYITDDIFVTYKREFGQNNDNNLVPETISLEYEITKFLYLQMLQGDPKQSGIDLFFKLDWY